MKLISMTEFVLNEQKNIMWDSFNKVVRYANFLKQPLTLGMFIPCDEDGNVIECTEENLNEYNKALERVLFEGFSYQHTSIIKYDNYIFSILDRNIETLIKINCKPILTDSAIKQLGL